MDDQFNLFLECVDESNRGFAAGLDEYLTNNDCKRNIKLAKSGYTVSYLLCDTKKTLATFLFRKSGVKLRIYPKDIAKHQDFIDSLPEGMKKEIRKASVCKRMVDPSACNPKCVMGYGFSLDGETYQKCRHMAFMPALNEENNPYIRQFVEKALSKEDSSI